MAMLGLAGVTATETSAAALTVRLPEPEMPPEAAVMVVVPAAPAVARPWDPAVLLMTAAAVFEDVQVTAFVIFWVVASEKVPVAINCCEVPLTIVASDGVTAMETSVARFTFRPPEPQCLPQDALIVVEPSAFANTCPAVAGAVCAGLIEVAELPVGVAVPVVLMTATSGSDVLHSTTAVRSAVELSE